MERSKTREMVDVGMSEDSPSGIDDSLTDFKSPKLEKAVPVKLRVVTDARTKKPGPKSKTTGKKQKETAKREIAQPSIESSFFKATINGKRDGHTCPLCMKYFDDKDAGSSHTKSCAARNHVSTKKLLAAVALQERQEDERVAMGLPAGPILQPKTKAPRKARETAAKVDPDLQLALALSKSLQENQLEQDLEEAILLAAEHRGDGKFTAFAFDNERRKTLKNFGFLTDKPVEVPQIPPKTRRKKHLGPTILQSRSKETRDRILTERIAEVLMGNEAITQISHHEIITEVSSIDERRSTLKSKLLKGIHEDTKRLWKSAQLPETVTNFYVHHLGPIIAPVVSQKPENSSNSEKSDLGIENKVEEIVKGAKGSITDISEDSPSVDDDRDTEKMSETSEEVERTMEFPEKSSESPEKLSKSPEKLSESPKKNYLHVTDRRYRNTLTVDWANTLNVSSTSDVVILLEKNHIWAHKLVFHVRCSNILLDCEQNDDSKFFHVKEKINWPDVDYSAGLTFLEFVYTGVIEKNVRSLVDKSVTSGVRRLARKYRIKDLFDYLRNKKSEIDVMNDVADKTEGRRSGLRSPIVIEADETPSEVEKRLENNSENLEPYSTKINSNSGIKSFDRNFGEFSTMMTNRSMEKTTEMDIEVKDDDATSVVSLSSSRTSGAVSPDLFDETTEEGVAEIAINDEMSAENSRSTDNENSNLKVLADLMAENDFSPSTDVGEHSTASTLIPNEISEKTSSAEESNDVSTVAQTETPKSRGITGKTTKIVEESRSQLFPEKQKSNLSLFIEKVRKINARDALDSHTEEESPAFERKRRRNPFRVKKLSDSSILDSDDRARNDERRRRDKKRGLSVFEEKLRKSSNSSSDENHERSTVEDDSADDEEKLQTDESRVVDENDDDNDISAYSKYRKINGPNNSIDNYKNMLKKWSNVTGESDDDEKTDDSSSTSGKPIDLTQESDTDVDRVPSPMSGIFTSDGKKNVNDDCGDESIHSASTDVVNFRDEKVSEDDEADETAIKAKTGFFRRKKTIDENETNRKSLSMKLNDEFYKNANIENSIGSSLDEKTTKTDEKKNSTDDSRVNKDKFTEYSIDSTPESSKSLTNSLRELDQNLLEPDDEIFAQSWKSQMLCISSTSSAHPVEYSSFRSKRSGENIEGKKSDRNSPNREKEKIASNCPENLEKFVEYPDLDVFEIDENIFTQSLRKSRISPEKTFTPMRNFDNSRESTNFAKKLKSDERRRKNRKTIVENFTERKSSTTNISEYPDIDVDELFTQSLKNTEETNRRFYTPKKNDRSVSPENFSSPDRRRRRSDEDRTNVRESFVDCPVENNSHRSSERKSSPDYCLDNQNEHFQSDDHYFPHSFRSPRLSPYESSNENRNFVTTLKVPSPILISSSPEFVLDDEKNISNREKNISGREKNISGREKNVRNDDSSASDRRKSLFSRTSVGKSVEDICSMNDDRGEIFLGKSLENLREEISPLGGRKKSDGFEAGTSGKRASDKSKNSPNLSKNSLVRWNSMPASSSKDRIDNKRSRTPKKRSRLVMSQDVTPPVNYDAMDTPELRNELNKYGIKPQKRSRARQLLNHIYNELHPVVALSTLEKDLNLDNVSSDNDEPPAKIIVRPTAPISDDSDSDVEFPSSQRSPTKDAARPIPEEMDFADGDGSTEDMNESASTSCIKKAFCALIKDDEEMHNKLLTYEPLPLELLSLMLKARGLKCKTNELMDFLDEECITFQVQSQRSRTRKKIRGGKISPSGKSRGISQKS